MAKVKFCSLCQRHVQPKKNFNWAAFLLLCLTGIGGIFYLLWYFLKGRVCPICGNKDLY